VSLEEIQQAVQRVAREVGPSVVGVGRRWGLGSGIVVAPGKILTNAHNVRGDETTVTLPDGRSLTVGVAGTDVDADLAVVALEDGAGEIAWGDGEEVEIGAPVFALANPAGRGLRVTAGFVSSTERSFRGPRGRRISGSIEHTAPLVRGSSGGPIVDAAGRLLGINTNRLGDGFYLAIPAGALLRERVEALARGESVAKPRLGLGLAPSHVARRLRRAVGLPEAEGLLVRMVEEDGAAERAGLREGDLITEAGGRALASADDLYEVLDSASETLELRVVRGSEELNIAVSFNPSRSA
jgi:serine protease Do